MTKGLFITPRFYFGGTNGTLKMLRFNGLKMSSSNDKLHIEAPEVVEPKQFATSIPVLLVWKNMKIKTMTVSYKPGTNILGSKPMPYIRISNRYLEQYGFEHGDKIVVQYRKGKITITKHEQHNRD